MEQGRAPPVRIHLVPVPAKPVIIDFRHHFLDASTSVETQNLLTFAHALCLYSAKSIGNAVGSDLVCRQSRCCSHPAAVTVPENQSCQVAQTACRLPLVAGGVALRQPFDVEPRKVDTLVDPIAALVEEADGSVGQRNQAAISAGPGVD